MPREILILTPFYSPNIGGAESFTEGLAKEACRWFNITVLTYKPLTKYSPKYEEHYKKRGYLRIYRIGWLLKPFRVWRGTSIRNALFVLPKMTIAFLYLLLRKKFDIVHAQGLLSALIAVSFKRIFRYKVFITLLAIYNFNNWKGLKKNLAAWILENCDIIFVEGNNGKKDIKNICSENHIRIFNHWVDQQTFKPPRHRFNDKIRVLFIGRPIKEKGRHIIEGAERLLNNPKYEFTYVENAPFKDLPKIYQDHHICCVPSLYDEGFSRVVAEAASCGCEVIVSDRGSLPEMVKEFGTIINPDQYMFANCIESYDINNHDLSVKYAKKYFSCNNANVILNEYN